MASLIVIECSMVENIEFTFMKNSTTNMPNNEKVKRKVILDFGIFFLSESSFVSPSRSAYLVIVIERK